MAEDNKETKDKKEEKEVVVQGKKSILPVIAMVVSIIVGFVVVAFIAFFITTQNVSTASNDNVVVHHDPGLFVKLGDAKEGILVNVGGPKAGKFLKAGIVLEVNPNKSDNVADGKLTPAAETKILDTTMQVLREAKLEELNAAHQEALKDKLRTALNNAIGSGSVYDVYVTSFLLQ